MFTIKPEDYYTFHSKAFFLYLIIIDPKDNIIAWLIVLFVKKEDYINSFTKVSDIAVVSTF